MIVSHRFFSSCAQDKVRGAKNFAEFPAVSHHHFQQCFM